MHGRGLGGYVARRLLLLIPLLVLVTVAVFLLTSLVPGGPVAALIGGHATDTATVEAIRAKYHLNDPLYVQYWYWLRNAVRGDLGVSIYSSQPVVSAIASRLLTTLVLNVFGIVVALVLGVGAGVLAAKRRGGPIDRTVVAVNVFWSSAPHFVLAIAALYVFGMKLHWFPLFGVGSGGMWDRAWHLVLPGLVMALGPLAFITKITRAAVLDQLGLDHVAFARSRGISPIRVLRVHVLRNAMIPILTAAGLLLVGLLTGTVFVETVFGIPGLGGLLVTSIQNSDLPVIQGLVLLVAAWIIVANLMVDLLYAVVDPKVRFTKAVS